MFVAGHAETGNDLPVLLSTTRAERVEGGYTFTGKKSFMDVSDPNAPKVVRGFVPRSTPGVTIKESWDVLGKLALGINPDEQPRRN